MAVKKQKPVKAEKPKYKAVFERVTERCKALEKSVKRRKDIEDKEQPAKKDTDPWGYKVTKLGKCLLERLRNKKPQGIFESLMDCSEEQFNFLADFARSLTKSLGLTENVEKLKSVTKFTYAYKKTSICVVAISERPTVMFPCMDEYTTNFPVKRYADNPLLPFLGAFFQIDTHIYGPAQGLYKVYYAMLRGYLICRYPETRERLCRRNLLSDFQNLAVWTSVHSRGSRNAVPLHYQPIGVFMNGECSRCHSKLARYNNTLDMGGSVKVVANTDWTNCHEEYAHSFVGYNLCEDCQRKLQEFMGCVV